MKKINYKIILGWAKKNSKLIILIYGVIITILFFMQSDRIQKLKTNLSNEIQNTSALSDSVETYKNKAKETVFQKDVLIADKKRLQELNAGLLVEVNKEKAKVLYLSSALIKVKSDTIYIPSEIIKYPNNAYGIDINFDTIYNSTSRRVLVGESDFSISEDGSIRSLGTKIFKDEIYIKIITGLKKEKDDKLKIFIKSDFPGFNVSEIEGAIVDPSMFKDISNKKKWSVGPNISVGIGSNFNPAIFIGVGVQYCFLRF